MPKASVRPLKWLVFFALLAIVVGVWEPSGRLRGWISGEAFFEGRPSHVWRRSVLLKEPDKREAALAKLREGGPDSVPVLRELLAKAPEAEVRWTAAELLGAKQGAARDASSEVLAALADPDAHVRSVAATAVPEVETPADTAVPALIKQLETEATVPVIRALSRYGADAKPALTVLLEIATAENREIEVRWNAIRTLGKMRVAGAEAIPTLLTMLDSPESRIREHAAESLGDIGPPSRSVVERLFPLLSDPDTKVRRDSVRSIGQIGAGPEAIPLVEKLVKDPEQIVRDAATKTLAQLRDLQPDVQKP
jgi:HEAT repeat protein